MYSVTSSRSPKKQLDTLSNAEKALMGALSAVKEAEKEIKGDIIDLCTSSVEENSDDKENEQVKRDNTLVKQKPHLRIKQEKHNTPPVSSIHLPFKLPKRGMPLQEEAGEEEARKIPHLLASPPSSDKGSSSGDHLAPNSPVSASTALPFDDMNKKVLDKKEGVTPNGKASAVKVESVITSASIGPPRLGMQNDNKTIIKEEDATPSGDGKMHVARSPLLVKVITSVKNINNTITSPLKTKRDSSATKSTKKEEDQDPDDEAEDKLIVLGEEVNEEEDVLFECTVKPSMVSLGDFSNNSHGWLSSATGIAKLYCHHTTGKTRLVQRNAIGTVKLNLAISSESVWGLQRTEKVVRKFGRSKEVSYVSFFALEKDGWSRIALKVGRDDVNNLFEHLKEMTN